MDLLGKPLHAIGKAFLVDEDRAIRAAAVGPAVVENDMLVANVAEAVLDRIWADSRTRDSETSQPREFQLFQPTCGVSARPLLTA